MRGWSEEGQVAVVSGNSGRLRETSSGGQIIKGLKSQQVYTVEDRRDL